MGIRYVIRLKKGNRINTHECTEGSKGIRPHSDHSFLQQIVSCRYTFLTPSHSRLWSFHHTYRLLGRHVSFFSINIDLQINVQRTAGGWSPTSLTFISFSSAVATCPIFPSRKPIILQILLKNPGYNCVVTCKRNWQLFI